MLTNFTKNYLINRLVVELRNGEKYLVCGDVLINDEGIVIIEKYSNDLKYKNNDYLDVMKVFKPISYLRKIKNVTDEDVIWERKDANIREMTLGEVEDILGYKIKIVNY